MGFSIISDPLGSVNFNGTTNSLNAPSSSVFNLSTGAWTIEGWFYLTAFTSDDRLFTIVPSPSTQYGFYLRSGTIYLGLFGASEVSLGTISLSTWTHLAFVKSSGSSTITCYKNGVSTGSTAAYTFPNSNCSFYIGASPANFSQLTTKGNISNVRVVNGVAVYTGTFTVPTAPLLGVQSAGTNISAITGTQTALLLNTPNNSAFITDSSSNNFTITNTGSVTAASLTPFVAGAGIGGFSIISNPLGSVSLNGTTQYLSAPGNAAFGFGTGDFTVEAWINLNNVSATKGLFFGVGTNSFGLRIGQSYAGNVNGLNIVKSGVADLEYCVFTFSTGTWYHIAVVRIGTTIYFFVNGTQQTTLGSGGGSFNFTTPSSEYIGSNNDTNEKYAGYISNLRVVKGVGVYSGNFTVPTAPLLGVQSSGTNISAITGTQTSLLLNTPNNSAFITDSSANQFTITNTGTATAASLTPFAAGSGGWQFTSLPVTPTVEYLVVAGGAGGGGAVAGGGGAGGFRTATGFSVSSSTSYTVTVGAGGAAGVTNGSEQGTQGGDGTDSVFSTITSTAGGGGGTAGPSGGTAGLRSGRNGGSGGGGAGNDQQITTGGTGNTPSTSPSQGNNGGSNSTQSNPYPAAGGGGASAAGSNGSGSQSGAGGAGTASSISGSSVTYAGGGGGGSSAQGAAAGAGGTGGGGTGQTGSVNAVSGTANTGGGGGGGRNIANVTAGAGGSGIVIIAYPNTYSDLVSVGAGLTCNGSAGNTTPDTASRSGYKVYRFTAGTGTISW